MLSFFIDLFSKKIIKTDRVTKMAVNIEQIIPVLNVMANPFIGPDPTHANTKAAISVVILASKIVKNALS